MKTQADKTQESQNSITPRVASEASNGGTAQLKDHRTSTIAQRKLQQSMDSSSTKPIQRKNNTGLPDNLKSGIENLSGYSMDDVKVHYNSSKPAQLQAHAYAQGTDIHLAPGQEKHLPHEAWHVVQQKQGRVQPTRQLKSKVNINDDVGLEKEADVMGARALQEKKDLNKIKSLRNNNVRNVMQRKINPIEINEICDKIGIDKKETVKIAMVKKGRAIKYNTPLSAYGEGYTYGLKHNDLGRSYASINQLNKESYDKFAEDGIAASGGGAYDYVSGILMVNEKKGKFPVNQVILHELGHHKQSINDDFHRDNTDNVLLEFHNVMFNENSDTTKMIEKRVFYGNYNLTDSWFVQWGSFKNDRIKKEKFLEKKLKFISDKMMYANVINSKEEGFFANTDREGSKEKDLVVFSEIFYNAMSLVKDDPETEEDLDGIFYALALLHNLCGGLGILSYKKTR
ncbi:DUF4157 domain-containing protein [Aquimarina sp. MMG016]|uniref:eCIS core domain-containing protein n=1 Tax=Aquimarina sp. MMG016 TaxID=2822690 RepID=UPI001B3A42C5|nr:DUF4157 domain-containing protein [Aquimarina sp. MMG016]MBQ4820690.1 DUF4157 domain-containing protein [Aquimarina sp. MMG016]